MANGYRRMEERRVFSPLISIATPDSSRWPPVSELPDDFDCTITNWEYIYSLCRDVSDEVRHDEFEPDVVVALARGGWFAGRCLCDFLGLDDLTSLKMEHYVGTAEKTGEPTVRYPMPEGSVEEKTSSSSTISPTPAARSSALTSTSTTAAPRKSAPRRFNSSRRASSSPTTSANG